METINNTNVLLEIETSNDKQPKGCDAYNYETGICNITNKLCDTCYSNMNNEF